MVRRVAIGLFAAALFVLRLGLLNLAVARVTATAVSFVGMANPGSVYGANMMGSQKLRYSLVVVLLALLAGQPGAAAAGIENQSPEDTVKTVTTEMLTALRSRQEAYKNDPGQLVSLIERVIAPHFDIRIMAREALGVYWRRATPEQQKRFIASFRQLLVDDYANEFRGYSNQSVEFLPEHAGSDKEYALVATHVTTPGEKPVRVDYRLYRVGSGWRIYDVEVDGISLLFTYRNTFSEELQSETLDTLIARMEHKNESFNPSAGK
jgi:phospholipid transport system substrate-binding protein